MRKNKYLKPEINFGILAIQKKGKTTCGPYCHYFYILNKQL